MVGWIYNEAIANHIPNRFFGKLMITIRVLFLGPAKDLAGLDSITLEFPDSSSVTHLRQQLAASYPDLANLLSAIRFAVNETFVEDDTVLQHDDEVALIPPVSGGSSDLQIYIDLVRDPISIETIRKFITSDPGLGGIVTFEGVTRLENDEKHGNLVRLDYEAYESLARKEMRRLADEVSVRWSAGKVVIVHRIGPVGPGEVSVMISVACTHRVEAFEACRWLIDTLKRCVPIWKKDVYEDGFVHWVEPPENDVSD